MRFFSVLANDIRYQIKYGFYFLYAFISAVYVAILAVVPAEYKRHVASIIILSDPAMLGMFFIGGIWLLEKEEGLHGFWNISPLKCMEYITSKALSLSVISTVSAVLIVLIGLGDHANFLILSISVLIGSFIFTLLGLVLASHARSVNNYILIASPAATLISVPPILLAFGVYHPVLDIFPGTALWRIISFSIGMIESISGWLWALLGLWLGVALVITGFRIPSALLLESGVAYHKCNCKSDIPTRWRKHVKDFGTDSISSKYISKQAKSNSCRYTVILTLRLFKIGLRQIVKDGILLMLVPAAFITGTAFKYVVPIANIALENNFSFSLLPYYGLFDGLLICLTPMFTAMVCAFLLLEERDENLTAFYQITPGTGLTYLLARIGLPMLWAFATSIGAILFSISDVAMIDIIFCSVIGSMNGLFLAVLVVMLAGNRVEGLVYSKLLGVNLLGLFALWFVPSPFCYLLAFLPSFWIGKIIMDGFSIFYLTAGLIFCLLWIGSITFATMRMPSTASGASSLFSMLSPSSTMTGHARKR